MPIVTVSRGSYSHGKEVAERVAQKLGYGCIAREVLLEASQQFNVPEVQLVEAIEAAPSAFDPLTHRKKRFVAYIQAALLRKVQGDNVVYHGFAGHFFLRTVPNVLKVRILADLEERIRIVMERDGLNWGEAARTIEKLDEQRRRWSLALYNMDPADPSLYDLTLNIRQLSLEGAVELICQAVTLPEFRTTPEALHRMQDLLLEAEVRIALGELGLDFLVHADRGRVRVDTRCPRGTEQEIHREVQAAVAGIPNIQDLRVEVLPGP
jgi:cytidylate kinase